jgi:hypothetical protein
MAALVPRLWRCRQPIMALGYPADTHSRFTQASGCVCVVPYLLTRLWHKMWNVQVAGDWGKLAFFAGEEMKSELLLEAESQEHWTRSCSSQTRDSMSIISASE